jgi:hypothetical protein
VFREPGNAFSGRHCVVASASTLAGRFQRLFGPDQTLRLTGARNVAFKQAIIVSSATTAALRAAEGLALFQEAQLVPTCPRARTPFSAARPNPARSESLHDDGGNKIRNLSRISIPEKRGSRPVAAAANDFRVFSAKRSRYLVILPLTNTQQGHRTDDSFRYRPHHGLHQ